MRNILAPEEVKVSVHWLYHTIAVILTWNLAENGVSQSVCTANDLFALNILSEKGKKLLAVCRAVFIILCESTGSWDSSSFSAMKSTSPNTKLEDRCTVYLLVL